MVNAMTRICGLQFFRRDGNQAGCRAAGPRLGGNSEWEIDGRGGFEAVDAFVGAVGQLVKIEQATLFVIQLHHRGRGNADEDA